MLMLSHCFNVLELFMPSHSTSHHAIGKKFERKFLKFARNAAFILWAIQYCINSYYTRWYKKLYELNQMHLGNNYHKIIVIIIWLPFDVLLKSLYWGVNYTVTAFDRDHQTHYEQWGELSGRVQIEGGEERLLQLKTIRDHSYGMHTCNTLLYTCAWFCVIVSDFLRLIRYTRMSWLNMVVCSGKDRHM